MKIKYSTLLVLLITAISFLVSSCAKNNGEHSLLKNCPFVNDDSTQDGYIDDNERMLMEECFANRLTETNEIRNNLVGEWQLIGHGQGWFHTVSQPCASLLITDTELIFNYENRNIDTQTIHTWELDVILINTPQSFRHRINITPNLEIGLGLSTFCDNYMYGDATPSDGNMYLFEKVK